MEEKEICGMCENTGVIFDEDNGEYIPCPKGCELEVDDEVDDLLEDKNLFPDELPIENKMKWDNEEEDN